MRRAARPLLFALAAWPGAALADERPADATLDDVAGKLLTPEYCADVERTRGKAHGLDCR